MDTQNRKLWVFGQDVSEDDGRKLKDLRAKRQNSMQSLRGT